MRIIVNGKLIIEDVVNILISKRNMTVFLRKEGKRIDEHYTLNDGDTVEIKIF